MEILKQQKKIKNERQEKRGSLPERDCCDNVQESAENILETVEEVQETADVQVQEKGYIIKQWSKYRQVI